ncbi:MAG: WG repeat-containing protein [Roseibacillus sp.]|nr:WG repeat-containing protein [Roseibacillus sp.]
MKTSFHLSPILALVALLAGSLCLRAELREFTDVKGRKISAELLGLNGESMVNLRMESGKMVTVALARLSEADQSYIQQHPVSKLTPITLPEKALVAVKDWNARLQRDESYFINVTGQRAFRRAIGKIHHDGFASGLWQYAVIEGPHLGLLDAKGMAMFGVSRVGPTELRADSDAPIFLARYGTGEDAYVQYLRKDGKPFINTRFAGGRPFNNERAWVNLEAADRPGGQGQGNGTWTLIDYQGNLLHAFEDLVVNDFSQGRAGVALDIRASQWAIIDKDAEVIAEGPFSRVGKFINGSAVVDGRLMNRDGEWLMEKKGEWQIERRYENSQSDAIVARRTKRIPGKPRFGILRRSTGEFIADVPDDYYVDRGFFNGLAVVRNLKTQNFGYISRTGDLIIPTNFSRAAPFNGGYAHVSLEQLYERAVINLAGEVIWKARLQEIAVPEEKEKPKDPPADKPVPDE